MFLDTKGREHHKDIRPSRWPRKEYAQGRGLYQSQVGKWLSEVYNLDYILEEFPCFGEGLFLDFFLPRRKIAVEVHGSQHFKYNKFFHATRADFIKQQKNDVRKQKWCELNDITLVVITHGEEEEKVKKCLP